MNLLIENKFEESEVLYRILDFFAAADIIKNSRLMFSRGDTFLDKNEGVDILLRQLELTHTHACINMGWSDSESARKKHEQLKCGYYMSCWTQTRESVALWSL